jgi:ATP-binding cassette subfamily F protein 3
MSLLSAEGIVKEYRNHLVLNGVTLRVHRGERLALTGPNGSGKTTLLRIMMGIEVPDQGKVIRARQIRIGYLSQNLHEVLQGRNDCQTALDYEKVAQLERKLREMERELAQIFQNGSSDETESLLKKYSHLVNQYESMDGYNIESKIKSILLGLGLREEALTIPIERLSGGEKMRVALARLLLEEPDLLVLDEPTNHLDMQATEWLESFLRSFSGGVLMVSHDRYFMDQVATRTAELEMGTITEITGNYSTFVEQKQKKMDHLRQERKRLKHQIKKTNLLTQKLKSMGNHRAAESRMKTVRRMRAELEDGLGNDSVREHLHSIGNLRIKFTHARHISAEIARAENLVKRYGDVVLFSGANFLIEGGEKIGIIGPNGCGKTTLINILMGADTDFEGFARLGPWVKYGYIGQEITFRDENATIREEIIARKEMKEEEMLRYLSNFQFYGDEVEKKIKVLSGGERVRLLLASLMLDEPHCLILDEPTNHLDIPARESLERALLLFKGSVIAVSHDRYFLTRCVDRILGISEGKIVSYTGNYEDYRQGKAQMEKQAQDRPREKKATPERRSDEGSARDDAEADLKEIEERIMGLEEKMKALQESFDQDTPYQKYQEYQSLEYEMNELYQMWENKQLK